MRVRQETIHAFCSSVSVNLQKNLEKKHRTHSTTQHMLLILSRQESISLHPERGKNV